MDLDHYYATIIRIQEFMLLVGVKKANYPGAYIDKEARFLTLPLSEWDNMDKTLSVYNSAVDTQSYGLMDGFLRRAQVGGHCSSDIKSGSRGSSIWICSTRAMYDHAARGCKYNIIILGLLGLMEIIGYLVINGKIFLYIMKQ